MKKLHLLLVVSCVAWTLLPGCTGLVSAPPDHAESVTAWKLFAAVHDDHQHHLTLAQIRVARESLRAIDTPVSKTVAVGGPFVRRSGGVTFAYFNSGFPYLYIVEFEPAPASTNRIRRAGYYTTEGEPLRGNPWK